MRRKLIIGAALAASLPVPASAEVTPQLEMELQCAAAARVSTLLLKDTAAPADLQESYATFLSSVTRMLNTTPSAEMTADVINAEVARRMNLIVDRLNTLPDDAFREALFKHISLEPGGGMAVCDSLINQVKTSL